MAEEGFLLSESYLDAIDDAIDKINEGDIESSFFGGDDGGEGIWVRLTAEGDDSIVVSDFGEPYPYKAERVVFNPTTHEWEPTDPVYTFDPDSPLSGTNLDAYVYALSGTIGLVEQVVRISLHAFKQGEGALYWGFHVNGDTQFAAIVMNESADSITYQAQQLDKTLTPTGKQYGVEFPYITELNGKTDVEAGKIVMVMKNRENFYFADSAGGSDVGLARITGIGSCDPGSYEAENLDKDLVAIPNETFGVDVGWPCLKEVMSREKLELVDTPGSTNGEIVMWVKKEDEYYFRWDDPRCIMGPEASPEDNENGKFLPFVESGKETGGIIRNFNPTTGQYEYARLIAIGPPETPAPDPGYDPTESGVVRGLKITEIDSYNYKIELIDGNGDNTITPAPPGPGPTPPPPVPQKPTFCTFLEFNTNTRELVAMTFRQEDGQLICEDRVKIPCCDDDGGEDPYDPPPDDPEDPEDPYEDPDDPYEDDCVPPDFQCGEEQEICYPIASGQEVSKVNVNNNSAANRWDIGLTSVVGPNGDVTADFAFANRAVTYNSNNELPEGEYTVQYDIQNISSAPCDEWVEPPLFCNFSIVNCYCDDDSDTEEDDVTDYCPVSCASYDLEADGPLEVVIDVRRPQDSGDTVDLRFKASGFKFGPYLDTNNELTEVERGTNGSTEIIRPVQPQNNISYMFRANINFEKIGHDAERSRTWDEEVIVDRVDPNGRPRTQSTGSRQYKGRIRAIYIGNVNPNRRRFKATFYFQNRIYAVEGTCSQNNPVITKEFSPIYARGTMTQSMIMNEEAEGDPTERDENIVGRVRVTDNCPEDDWCFSITGGIPVGEELKFGIRKIDNQTAEIFAKPGTNIVLATRTLTIEAKFCGPSDAYPLPASPLCTLTENFVINAASVFDDLDVADVNGPVDTGIANVQTRGVAGEPVARMTGTVGGVRTQVPDGQMVSWKVVSATNPDTGLPFAKNVSQPFQVDNSGSDVVLTAAYDLKPGDYTVKVQTQNRQMIVNGENLEKEFTITVTKGTEAFRLSELIG